MSKGLVLLGEERPGVCYRPRPSAYGIARDGHGRIAILRVGSELFLPGGGIEPEESPPESLVREVREETGCGAEIVRALGRAVEFLQASGHRTPTRLEGWYYEIRLGARETEPVETDHELVWLEPLQVITALTHRSQAAMVERHVLMFGDASGPGDEEE